MPDSMTTRRDFLTTATALTLSATAYARIPGANERVGLGLIGYGLIGQTHARTFAKLDDAEILAVCDVHRGRRAEGAKSMRWAAGRV